MRAVTLVVVAALMSVVVAQTGYCQGWNVTLNPGLQPTNQLNPSNTQTQICPFGFIRDITQGGRCITYRQAVNNYFGAPCFQNSDCTGSMNIPLGCGRDKTCTWLGTRNKGDSCTDNINCAALPALNGTSVSHGCSKETKTCDIYTHVLVPTNARCNYTENNQLFLCDNDNACVYYSTPTTPNPDFGAGICTPLRKTGEFCSVAKPDGATYSNLWCAGKQACFGQFPNNKTCVAPVKENQPCFNFGTVYDCDQTGAAPLYCNGVSKTCVQFSPAGANCTSNFLSVSGGNICQMGLRCYRLFGQSYETCNGPAPALAACTNADTATTTPLNTNANCTAGLQCITQTARGVNIPTCYAGANGDICQIYGGTPPALIDSCQPGLFCQQYVPANYTCVPKLTIGTFCNATRQCVEGTTCFNSTCTAFQTLGQPCQELVTHPLNYLRCNPSLQCSRGVCINNYTVPLNGYCSQDRDCENAHCDTVLKRCTRRKLCYNDGQCGAGNNCACSSGVENMGNCFLNNCGKPSKALQDCLNPLIYNPYANASFYVDDFFTPLERTYSNQKAFFLDSGSSFYSKCSGQHNDYVRCRGLMSKWAAPATPLGDFINYDLATISASSSVSVSIVAMIAFIMTLFMNL